jgi:hypothetical protein
MELNNFSRADKANQTNGALGQQHLSRTTPIWIAPRSFLVVCSDYGSVRLTLACLVMMAL